MDQWQQLQALPLEAKLGLAVTVVVAIVGFAQWRAIENRQKRSRREDWNRDDERDRIAREEQAERDRREQDRLKREKQAILTFWRVPEEIQVAVGSALGDRVLMGTLWNRGMSDASVVGVRAFLNKIVLPPRGLWPSQQTIAVGDRIVTSFNLPFKVEPTEHEDSPRLDEALADAVIRLEVRFNDASAPNRLLESCYRFDKGPLPKRWLAKLVDCSESEADL